MKLNWGHKLVFFTSVFMLFIIAMVYKISTQKVELVDENYYENGIRYQEEINKYAASRNAKHVIDFSMTTHVLTFKTLAKNTITGEMHFYRPSDSKLDFVESFTVDAEGNHVFSTAELKKGPWKVTYEWKSGDTLMAAEKQFVVQ
ncbi:MAG: FixH family protein [Bacteroidota bacterium]